MVTEPYYLVKIFLSYRFDSECKEYVSHCRRILKALSEHIYKELTSIGVKIVQPKGGFYMMPDFEVFIHHSYFLFVSSILFSFSHETS